MIRMPWGKHKGWPIMYLPDNYLLHILFGTKRKLKTETLLSIQDEVERRWPGRLPFRVVHVPAKNAVPVRVFNRVYMALLQQYSDQGQAILVLNEFMDLLIKEYGNERH